MTSSPMRRREHASSAASGDDDAPVRVRGFSKSYGTTRAVDALDLRVERGMLYGLIGPDGAGKTTTMRILVTLLRADAGEVIVCGHDALRAIRPVRSVVGYMPQRFSLYPDLSVDQNLDFFADLFGVPAGEIPARKQRLYAFSRLEPFARRQAGRLSGGMKQKLALSCTLIHDPELLVLDEPTTGVDPVSRSEFWTILRELTASGVTILVSTPYMDEALLCDRISIMHEGRCLIEGDPRRLTGEFELAVFSMHEPDLVMRSSTLTEEAGIRGVHTFGESLHITADAGMRLEDVQRACSRAFGRAVDLTAIPATLEDVFIHLIEGRRHAA